MPDVNTVSLGDNLELLRATPDESVDLCYADPPFNTGRKFGDFDDRWQRRSGTPDGTKDAPIFAVVEQAHSMAMSNYLRFMHPRITEMRRVMAPHGTLYLHCDPTASHYLKMLLDIEFGADNFLNEIIWSYRRWPSKMRNFQRMHDVILRYSRANKATWNQQYEPMAKSTVKAVGTKRRRQSMGADGKYIVEQDEGESKGMPMRAVWELSVLHPSAKERLKYDTQKPLKLLRRIIEASSNPGDVVLDPFCGSGTTLVAAAELGRRYIGFDQNPEAVAKTRARLAAAEPTLNFNKKEQRSYA